MSKTKAASRLLSSLLAILMVFCLFPKVEVQAAITTIPGEYAARYQQNVNGLTSDYIKDLVEKESGIKFPATVDLTQPIEVPFPANISGAIQTIGIATGVQYELQQISCRIIDNATHKAIWHQEISDFSAPAYVEVPEETLPQITDTCVFQFNCSWSLTNDKQLPTDNNMATITNWIASLDRKVTQNGTSLTLTEGNVDTYILQNDSKDGVVLTYKTSMNMENLGVMGSTGDGSWWNTLDNNRRDIGDDTIVFLHFMFDDEFDLSNADFSQATLSSDMFRLDHYDVVGQELILTCYWNGTKANSIEGPLDPIITLENVVVPIDGNWEGTTLTLDNYGYVDGIVYMYRYGTTWGPSEVVGIDGGEEYDTFALALPTPEPEPDEPSTIIPDDGPTISIRKVWVEDTEEDRPDSILVEIYHDEELYDTVEVKEKYRWRTSYNIPERYENDDWWVQEADVPEGYEDYIDETRDNVFVITNTYVGVEEESSEESSEPSVTPSEPSVEPSEPSSEPSEPTPEPEEPAEPTLPQTGQVWWPIIILLAGGAVLVAFGAFRTMRGNSRHGR